jgi:hypothetical protein
MSDVTSIQQLASFLHAAALALALVVVCWAALLAGLSRLHWFWRVSLLCVPLVLMLPIRAYEPLVMVGPLLVVLALTAAQLRGRWEKNLGRANVQHSPAAPKSAKTNRWSISLGDAWLGVTLLGMVLAVLVQLPWRNLHFSWPGLCFDAALIYGLAISCLGIVGLRRGTAWAVALFGGVFFGTVFETSWGDGLRALYLLGLDSPQHMNWAPLTVFLLVFVALLIVSLWLTRWCWQALPRPAVYAQRRRLVGSVLAIGAAPGAVLYLAMFVGPTEVPGPAIHNNSLPQLVAIAQRLELVGVGDLTPRELQREFPGENHDRQVEGVYREALAVVRQPGCVSLDISRQANEDSLPAQEDQLAVLRALARRWSREADVALRIGDVRRATEFDLGVLRLGNLLSRGGIRIHVQAATAIKSAGLTHLAMLRDQLPIDLVPAVLDVLEALDAGEENPQVTNARDRYWTDVAHGWRHRLESVVQRSLQIPSTETTAFQALKQPLAREAAHRRLLGTELALRHYHQQHGEYPVTLAALVPAHLALLPVDPFTQQALIYRPLAYSFVLYSAGPDARDDGGKFARFAEHNPTYIGQDWNLETLLRSGWRPHRWDLSSNQGPRFGAPAGGGRWPSSWERRPREPVDAMTVSLDAHGEQEADGDSETADETLRESQDGPGPGENATMPARRPQRRPFDSRWRNRWDVR